MMKQMFKKELNELLKKYNASMMSASTTIRVMFWDHQGNVKDKIECHSLNLEGGVK